MTKLSDRQLIENYFAGDEESLALLFKRYLSVVAATVSRYTNDCDEADDLAQETLVKAWRYLRQFDRQKNFRSWLVVIAKNTAIDWLRKNHNVPLSQFDDEQGNNYIADQLADLTPLADKQFDNSLLGRQLTAATNRLNDNYRQVIHWHAFDGLTFNEISRRLGEPLNTVKSRYRRGLAALRQMFS